MFDQIDGLHLIREVLDLEAHVLELMPQCRLIAVITLHYFLAVLQHRAAHGEVLAVADF